MANDSNTLKLPGGVKNPTLPQPEDACVPMANVLAWVGGGESVVANGIVTNLVDRKSGTLYPAITGGGAARALANELPYFDQSPAAAGVRGYSLPPALFGGLSALSVLGLMRKPTTSYVAGGAHYLFGISTSNASSTAAAAIRSDAAGQLLSIARRSTSAEAPVSDNLVVDTADWVPFCLDIDYINNRTRMSDLRSAKRRDWRPTALGGTVGTVSGVPTAASIFTVGASTSDTARWLGHNCEMVFLNTILSDAQYSRAKKWLTSKRRALLAA